MRVTLRRWTVLAYVAFALTVAAARHVRRARHRRHALRHVDAWPW